MAMDSSYTSLPSEVVQTYWHLLITRYVMASAASFYAWDCTLTLPREVELIWAENWTYVTAIYVINRYGVIPTLVTLIYYSLLSNPNTESCSLEGILGVGLGIFNILVVSVILQLRLHALYGQDSKLKIILSFLTFGAAVAMVGIAIMKLTHDRVGAIPGTPFCNISIPRYFYAFWIPLMLLEFIFLMLVCFKSFRHYKSLPNHAWRGTRLMNIMVRDSVLYFLCGFSMFLLNTLLWNFAGVDFFQLGVSWVAIIPPAMAARLILNIRQASKDSAEGDVHSMPWGPPSGLVFEMRTSSDVESS